MGSAWTCVDRDYPSPRDDAAAYKHYSHLYHWVHSCLRDPQILKRECANAFQSADKDDRGEMEKDELWRLTQQFMDQCECDSPHAVEAIYGAYSFMSQVHPSVSEIQFFEYMRIVLGVIERDLRDKVAKFGLRFPEQAPKVTHPESFPNSDRHLEKMVSRPVREAPTHPLTSAYAQVESAPRRVTEVQTPVFVETSVPTGQPNFTPPTGTRLSSEPIGRAPVGAKMEIPPSAPHMRTGSEPYYAYQNQQADRLSASQPGTLASPMSPFPQASRSSGNTPRAEPSPPLPVRGGAKQDPDATSALNGTDMAVEHMKHQILEGALRVGVFNQKLQVEWKDLKVSREVNATTGETVMKIAILDEDGISAAFQLSHVDVFGNKTSNLMAISQGVTANIMDNPPPPDRAVAFQFSDGTLCILFDDPGTCRVALKALKYLCEVPVYA